MSGRGREDRRYRSLVEATAHFVWISAPDGSLLHIDDDWLELVGLSLKEARGWTWLAAVHHEDRDAYNRAWREAVERATVFELEYRLSCHDGSVRWFFDRAVPVHDDHGAVIEWIGAGQDITERKEAEQELRRQREQYRTLVESTSAILWEGEPQTFRFTFVSQEAETLLGYPVRRWLDEPEFWVEHIHAEDRAWAPEYCARATAEMRQHTFDYRMLAADGRTVWLRDVVSVVSERGRPVKLVGVMVDITATKEAERELAYVSGLQQILVEVSGELVATGAGQLDRSLDTALARVGAYCHADRSFLFQFEDDAAYMRETHEWCAPGITPCIGRNQRRPRDTVPRMVETVERREVLHIPDVTDLGEEWSLERRLFDDEELQAVILVPLVISNAVEGYLGFDSVSQRRAWSDAEIRLLRGLADVIGATLHRSRAEERLRESQALLEIAGRTARLGGWRVDLEPERVVFSEEARAIRELPPGHDPGVEELLDAYVPESRARIRERYSACVRDGVPYDEELEFVTPAGRHIWVREIGEPVRDESGAVVQVRGSSQDITEKKQAEAEIYRLAERLTNTLESITDALYTLDRDWRFTYVNREAERVLQRDRETLLGTVVWEEFADVVGTAVEHEYRRAMEERRTAQFEFYYPPVDTWFEIHAYPSDEGLAVYFRDITEQKRTRAEIEFLALYDPLTHLPNRRLLLDRLQHTLATGHRDGTNGAVLFLDLDDFKTLNDTLGHDVGDRLLQQVAARLTASVRKSDTVARFGGDEFAIVLGELAGDLEEATAQAVRVGEKIRSALARPYRLGDSERHLTVSLGVAMFGGVEDTADDLMKRADLAMYQAKEAGRGTVRVFEPEMHAAVHSRVAIETALRESLERGEVVAHYQPQVDADGRVTGAEALARWVHPERGLISPAQFIPVAEATGLILPLGDAILEAACEQVAAWAGQPETEHLDVAVNISARQFHHPDFVTRVLAIIERTGADPGKLWLELTESLLLADVEDTITKMTRLKAEGIRFSLDDFGTGYSSLAYLKRLPLDLLKIDQSFVRDALSDSNDEAIVRTIIVLAHTMGIDVLAEGVETEEVRALLAEHGCLLYQGYLFGHPVPAERFVELMRHDTQPTPESRRTGPG